MGKLPILYLYTDFGAGSLYVGQLHALIASRLPHLRTVDLCHELEPCKPCAAAYLLAALAPHLAGPGVVVGVVDPGVGTPRAPILIRSHDFAWIGPDNGLFSQVIRETPVEVYRLGSLGMEPLSASFHGRDLFVPWALRLLAEPETAWMAGLEPYRPALMGAGWPREIAEIIHIDRFGNAVTGWKGASSNPSRLLQIGSQVLPHHATFGEAVAGATFWYVNSIGLVEVACNLGQASKILDLHVGDSFVWL